MKRSILFMFSLIIVVNIPTVSALTSGVLGDELGIVVSLEPNITQYVIYNTTNNTYNYGEAMIPQDPWLYNTTGDLYWNETHGNSTYVHSEDSAFLSISNGVISFLENVLNATIDARDSDTEYSESDHYLTLTGTVFGVNETALNATIDLRDNDTTYTEDSPYLSLTGTVFGFVESFLNSTIQAIVESYGYITGYTETDPYWTGNQSNYYNKSVVDSNITAGLEGQDECSEISGCVVGAITSYTETDPYWTGNYTNGYNNTEWDEAYGWGNHSDAGYLTSYTESDPLWSENESLIYKKTDTYNQTEIDNNLTDQDECSEITGCVVGAITSYTDTNCSLDNSCTNITYNSDTDAWDKNNTDDFISILNFTGTLTNGKLCRYNSSITGIDCDYTDQTGEGGTSDTNASTECNGEEVLLGNSSCLNSTVFFDDTDTDTDTNCSIDQSCSAIIYDTDESGLNVNSSNESLYWNGYNGTNATQFENENGALNIITSWLHGLIQAIVESYGYITGYIEADPYWTGNQSNYYNKSVVDSNITAGLEGQDECSEISGCVVGAITSYTETDPLWTGNYTNGYNNTEWDEAYGWGNHSDAGYLTTSQNDTYDATTAKVNSNETLWANQTATSLVSNIIINSTGIYVPLDVPIYFGNDSSYIMKNSTTGNLTICNQC